MSTRLPNFHVRCDRVNRRSFVGVGLLTALGLTSWSLSGPAALAGTLRGASGHLLGGSAPVKRRRHCILIWLDGGPSHLETFDPKPQAKQEIRGPLSAIPTRIPGIQLSECLPRIADQLHELCLIRSMSSPLGEHNLATQYLLTGYPPSPALDYPVMGSAVAHLLPDHPELPQFIAVPNHRVGGATVPAQGFLPAANAPFEIGGDPKQPNFRLRDLEFYPGLNADRIHRRREFLARLDRQRQGLDSGEIPAGDPWAQAVELITNSKTREAFWLEQESSAQRQAYGMTTVGQSCLLARRLVERGVSFVTVNFPGWDTHDNAYTRLKEGYTGAATPVGLVPQLDQAVAGLVADLKRRDLLDDTLVVVMGEFGRTPKLNANGGRDHWPRAFSVLLAGGGTPQGLVLGESDSQGETPKSRLVTPSDLVATIYSLLGFDPRLELRTADGRPIQLARDGQLISEIAG